MITPSLQDISSGAAALDLVLALGWWCTSLVIHYFALLNSKKASSISQETVVKTPLPTNLGSVNVGSGCDQLGPINNLSPTRSPWPDLLLEIREFGPKSSRLLCHVMDEHGDQRAQIWTLWTGWTEWSRERRAFTGSDCVSIFRLQVKDVQGNLVGQ